MRRRRRNRPVHCAADHRLAAPRTSTPADSAEVEPFDAEIHTEMVQSWCGARGSPNNWVGLLPPTGFVAANAAVGFLYKTDAPVALIDGLVADPAATAADRDAAVEAIFDALFSSARDQGFQAVWGYTARPEVVERARRIGFVVHDGLYTFGTKWV